MAKQHKLYMNQSTLRNEARAQLDSNHAGVALITRELGTILFVIYLHLFAFVASSLLSPWASRCGQDGSCSVHYLLASMDLDGHLMELCEFSDSHIFCIDLESSGDGVCILRCATSCDKARQLTSDRFFVH